MKPISTSSGYVRVHRFNYSYRDMGASIHHGAWRPTYFTGDFFEANSEDLARRVCEELNEGFPDIFHWIETGWLHKDDPALQRFGKIQP